MTPGTTSPTWIFIQMFGAGMSAEVANFWLRFLIVKVITFRGSFNSSGSGRSKEVAIRTFCRKEANQHILITVMTLEFSPQCLWTRFCVLCWEMPMWLRCWRWAPFCSDSSLFLFKGLNHQQPIRLFTQRRCPSVPTQPAPLLLWLQFLLHSTLSCWLSASIQYFIWGWFPISLEALSEAVASSLELTMMAFHFDFLW